MSKVNTYYSSNSLLVEIEPISEVRPPQDVVCVVDVSGSMSTLAELKTSNGSENNGLSILDVVKHSLNTIVSSLQPKDKFSVVTYSNNAKVTIPLSNVIDKDVLREQINKIKIEGMTNIWAGLMLGMEEIRKNPGSLRNQSVILLTDGLPNVSPPSGEVKTFKKFLKTNSSLRDSFTLHTCGFGYQLDSKMLKDLANIGSGSYSFIPDIGMVGTIFINLMSNIYNINSTHLSVTLPYSKNYFKSLSGYDYDSNELTTTIYLKSLSNDKSRYLLLETIKDIDNQELIYQENNVFMGHIKFTVSGNKIFNSDIYNREYGRYLFLNDLFMSLVSNDFNFDNSRVYLLTQDDDYSKNLLEDINGQIQQAFSRKDWMERWGKHYLLSLEMAHQNEWCNNFKDPGVQNYQSELFTHYQSEIEDIFITLNPPEPTYHSSNKVTSMNSYYNSGGVCYHGDCLVTLSDGTFKYVDAINKGDKVKTSEGSATVRTVVKSEMFRNVKMVKFESGLLITPYHPIRVDNKWHFPINYQNNVTEVYNDYIYSFVLDKHHTCFVNNIETVTLGHNFTGETIYHPFFGSSKVIEELKKLEGWEQGQVILPFDSLERHSETGEVYGIRKFD